MNSLAEDIRAINAGERPNQQKLAKIRVNGKATIKPRRMSENTIRLFCLAYIKHGLNGAAAYKATHPKASTKTASVEACRLLAKPSIQEVLQPMLRDLLVKAEIDAEWVFRRWIEQANASPLDYFHITDDGKLGALNLNGLTEAQRRNLKAIKVTKHHGVETITVTVCDQQHAVGMMARHLGLFLQKLAPLKAGRIGDLIEEGVKRIRKAKNLDAWKEIDSGLGFDDAT